MNPWYQPDRQQANAEQIASWLCRYPRVARVLYPAFPHHPGHGLLKKQGRGFGAMIAFEVSDASLVEQFLGKVRLVSFAESLGGVETLVTFPLQQTHADIEPAVLARLGIGDRLLRLSVGIESPGDIIDDLDYGGAFRVMSRVFARWGLEVSFVDATDMDLVQKAVRPTTRALYIETPSNPLLKITDLRKAAALAADRGLMTIVDNTFLTPCLQRPIELGCDVVLHSGSKFVNGHSDVIRGLAVTANTELGDRLLFIQNAVGAVLGPNDSWLTLRGLRTLRVRIQESQRSAMAIARWLEGQRCVRRVWYPGLPQHPGQGIHASPADGPGAVLSFELDSVERTSRLLEGVRLAAFAVSLGGVESILSYPVKMSDAAMPPEERVARGISDTLVRLSVGLESPEDLIEEMGRLLA